MRVVFTEIAEETHEGIIEFLSFQWTEREINIFLNDVDDLLKNLETGKFLQYQEYSDDIRSALIGKKHVRVYFRKENKNLIKILLFFNTRQNPDKLFEFLRP